MLEVKNTLSQKTHRAYLPNLYDGSNIMTLNGSAKNAMLLRTYKSHSREQKY